MNDLERRPAAPLETPSAFFGEWYLKGFADACDCRWPVVPWGPAGEPYKKGYALGAAAFRCAFFGCNVEWISSASGECLPVVADATF